MTNEERMELLRRAVEDLGSQAAVGRRLGYSAATVSQVLKGTYGGALDAFLTRVEETFDSTEVDCPMLGKIRLPVCVEERRRPFSTCNPHRVRMYQTCRKCRHNTDEKED